MAGASSISGLSSGLDTATIIDQLMQLEAAPQSRLKTQLTGQQSLVTTLQGLNSKLAALNTKADALARATAWSPLAAGSTNTAITVTAGNGAVPASFDVTVTSVARAHQLGFAEAHALTDVVTGASTKVVIDRFDGTPVELETGDGTLSSLVNAINDPSNNTGLIANTVKVSDGAYKLIVRSAETGAEQDFDLTGLDGSPLLGGATVIAGSDAAIDLGTGVIATSTSNTFTDLMPGVTLTLADTVTVGGTSRVSLARDTTAVSNAVKDLVDSVNSLLSSIDTQTAYNSSTKTAGALTGNSAVLSVRNELLNSVYPGDNTSLASVGIQVTRDGRLSFDDKAFSAAYAADPTGVAEKFTKGLTGSSDGFAARVASAAKVASDPVDGTLTSAISGRQRQISQLTDSIADWDTRLDLRRQTLERQYTALETALNQMQSQSSWLSSQIVGLSANS